MKFSLHVTGLELIINITPELYADLRNYGYSNREIAMEIGIPQSTLSKKISTWFRNGLLLDYYNVYLDKLMYPIEVCILVFNQRISIESVIYKKHPLTVYFSPIPKPTYFIYRRIYFEDHYMNYSFYKNNYKDVYRVILCSVVEKTLIPREEYVNSKIELNYNDDSCINSSYIIDEYDQYLAETLFKYYNPPISVKGSVVISKELTSMMRDSLYRNHYYRHLRNKLVKKRIIVRDLTKLEYSILLVYTNSLSKLIDIIYTLHNREIIGGVDQVNFISTEPVIALIHSWINRDKYWRHEVNHEYFSETRYDIYLIKQII